MPMKKPFPRSYWVVPGRFLAGHYPGDRCKDEMERRMQGLLNCGIRCIVNLMEPDERDYDGLLFADYAPVLKRLAGGEPPVECCNMPIRDFDAPSPEFMVRILDRIDAFLNENRFVYVHCWGGRGRTGTVVGCWLIRHGIAEGRSVLEKIRELRRSDPGVRWPSPETPDQVLLVRSWKKGQ